MILYFYVNNKNINIVLSYTNCIKYMRVHLLKTVKTKL